MFTLRRFSAAFALAFSLFLFASAQNQCTGAAIFAAGRCAGDEISDDERELFNAVNQFRQTNGKSPLRLSATLSILGNRRMLDLSQNMRTLTHSWSNCPYDIKDEKTWSCMSDSPLRLKSGYRGTAYETLYATGARKVEPAAAVAAWKKSPLHSSIILGTGVFASMSWDEFGVAISGGYAALWFGQPGAPGMAGLETSRGRGGALVEIGRVFRVTGENSRSDKSWRASSDSGRLVIDVADRDADLFSTELRFYITPSNGTVYSGIAERIGGFMQAAYPEWPDPQNWLEASLRFVVDNPGARKMKLTNKSSIEMTREASGRLLLAIRPKSGSRGRPSEVYE